MRSKGSFFNFTVLLRDITRFFPVWSLFSVFLGLVWLGLLLTGTSWNGTRLLMAVYNSMPFCLAVYAMLCAVTLFGDLYNSRLSNALHAMPLRREGWFFTHGAAGMLFFLVPFVLFSAALTAWIAGWVFALRTLLWGSLQFVLFYGMALLCVMLAGNRVGAVLLFGLLNFLAPVLQWIEAALYQPILYGIPLIGKGFRIFSPILQLTNVVMLAEGICPPALGWRMDWDYALLGSIAGLVMAVGALLLYRRRALETAGSPVSVRFWRPVFLIAFSLLVAVALFVVIGHEPSQAVFLILYMALGFFFGRMLVMRSIRVFQPMAFLWFGIGVFLLFGSLGLCMWDPLGVIEQTPQLSQVESVEFRMDPKANGTYQSRFFSGGDQVTDPEPAKVLLTFHEEVLQTRPDPAETDGMLYLTYHLKNGTTLRRYYPVNMETDAEKLEPAFSAYEVVFDGLTPEELAQGLISVHYDNREEEHVYFGEGASTHGKDVQVLAPELRKRLLKALENDCEEGCLVQESKLYGKDVDYALCTLKFWIIRPDTQKPVIKTLRVRYSNDTSFLMQTCYREGSNTEGRVITEETVEAYENVLRYTKYY